MANYRTGQELMAGLARLRWRTGRSLRNEHQRMEKMLRDWAVRQTSGVVSTRELRRLDHPFARRHGQPRLSPLPINRQTGRLQRSFRAFRRSQESNMVTQMQFTASYGKYVLGLRGTKYMLPRGFWHEFREFYQREKRAMHQELRRQINAG